MVYKPKKRNSVKISKKFPAVERVAKRKLPKPKSIKPKNYVQRAEERRDDY